MAIVTSGPFLGWSGSADGFTYYLLPDGRTCVKKKNRKSSIPPTQPQIVNRADTAIVSKFIKPFEEFIQVGYQLESKKTNQNPHNVMTKHVRDITIQGLYPDRKIDISKVLVSIGKLPGAAETSVMMTEQGLTFHWSTELVRKLSHYSDQVMMLAYFPELQEVTHVISGAQRHLGTDLLPLAGIKKGYSAEVFISFITNDHQGVSNSVYLGQFNW